MSAHDLAPGPWRVGDHGTIEDANGVYLLRFALRFACDESWREIAAELAAAREMREALRDTLNLCERWLDYERFQTEIDHARAALSKAAGQ
jgi:glutathione S-transferase